MNKLISLLFSILISVFCNKVSGQTVVDTVKTTTIKVNGISCNGDMPLIKKKLINQEGIDEVTFSEIKNEAVIFTIKFHSSVINEQKIEELIEGAPSCDDPALFPYKAKPFIPKSKRH